MPGLGFRTSHKLQGRLPVCKSPRKANISINKDFVPDFKCMRWRIIQNTVIYQVNFNCEKLDEGQLTNVSRLSLVQKLNGEIKSGVHPLFPTLQQMGYSGYASQLVTAKIVNIQKEAEWHPRHGTCPGCHLERAPLTLTLWFKSDKPKL